MNNLILTNVVPAKMTLSSGKSSKVNLYSSVLITFIFILLIGLLNFSQEANAAATPEKPAHF